MSTPKRPSVDMTCGITILNSLLPSTWRVMVSDEVERLRSSLDPSTVGLSLAELNALGEHLGSVILQVVSEGSKAVQEGKSLDGLLSVYGTPVNNVTAISGELLESVMASFRKEYSAASSLCSPSGVTVSKTEALDLLSRISYEHRVGIPKEAISWSAQEIASYIATQLSIRKMNEAAQESILNAHAKDSEDVLDVPEEWTDEDGVKHDQHKINWDLLPLVALRPLIRVLMHGATKYAPDNWKKIPNAERRYLAAALRHIDAHQTGDVVDDESGEYHLYHAMCCLLFAVWHMYGCWPDEE